MTHLPRAAAAALLLALAAGPAAAQPKDDDVRPVQTKPVVIAPGTAAAAPGADVTVPVALKGVKAAKGVRAGSLRLTFDPAVLEYKTVEAGPALTRAMVDGSADPQADPGKVGLVFACDLKSPSSKEFTAVEDDGVVLNVVFTVKPGAAAGAKSPVTADNFRVIDTGSPPLELYVTAEPGEVTVQSAGWAIPLKWILAALGGLLLLFLLMVFGRRRKRDEEPERRRRRYDDEPARRPAYSAPPAGGSAVPRFTPEGATTFAHACVKCGGVIQLPRAMAGHSFQCGACGATQVARG